MMTSYIIEKGNHYCLHPLKISYNKKRLIVEFIFTESCKYDLKSVDQFDWNKLIGIGFGFNHHKNSYRIGSRYDLAADKFNLCHYYYNKGVRSFVDICSVSVNQHCRADISFDRDGGKIWNRISTIEGVCWQDIYNGYIPYDFSSVSRLGFNLWPFQGGNMPAMHVMNHLLDIQS